MGRVMGCGLCPYNVIEKVGNYATSIRSRPEEGPCHPRLVPCSNY